MKNIAVLCSGNGTNLQAIINAVQKKKLKVHIALVLSDNDAAFALKRAARAGIKHVVVKRSCFASRSDFEKQIIYHLAKEKVELIVLAGFMRLLGPGLLSAYKNKIINIHPALLPSFKGSHGIQDAFDYGAKVTGITIHFVDDEMDHGPIIMQEAVPIRAGDTLKTTERRIHKVEHALYYKAIGLFAAGRLKIKGRKVVISGN